MSALRPFAPATASETRQRLSRHGVEFQRRSAPVGRFLTRHAAWVSLVIYLLAAMFMQRHAIAHFGSEIAGNGPEDPTQYMWAMWWWPHAILHGENPFVTHAIWVPANYNLAAVTSTPLPALVLAPVTLLAGAVQGPIISYNIAMLLAPVIGAWFAYRLCLALTRGSVWPSVLGGWLYGFSSYSLAVLQGHLHLAFTFLAPVLALLAIRFIRGEISRRRLVLLSALALACQLLCGTEMFFTASLLGALTLLAAFCLATSELRPRIVELAGMLILAYVLMAIVCSPFLYYALTGPPVPAGTTQYSADVLSFFIPTPDAWLGGKAFTAVSALFPGNTAEQGTYLGIPLILAFFLGVRRLGQRRVVRVIVTITVVAVIWSLGSNLTIAGQATWTMPFHWLASHKYFDDILPVRVGVYTALGTSVVAATWLGTAGGARWPRWLLALLAVVFLFPNANAVRSTGQAIYAAQYPQPAFIVGGEYAEYIKRNEVILPIPWGPVQDALLWQAQARGWFREASGWFGYFPNDYNDSPITGQLAGFSPVVYSATERLQMRQFLKAHSVGAIVIQDGLDMGFAKLFDQMGLTPKSVGGVMLYTVPHDD